MEINIALMLRLISLLFSVRVYFDFRKNRNIARFISKTGLNFEEFAAYHAENLLNFAKKIRTTVLV